MYSAQPSCISASVGDTAGRGQSNHGGCRASQERKTCRLGPFSAHGGDKVVSACEPCCLLFGAADKQTAMLFAAVYPAFRSSTSSPPATLQKRQSSLSNGRMYYLVTDATAALPSVPRNSYIPTMCTYIRSSCGAAEAVRRRI